MELAATGISTRVPGRRLLSSHRSTGLKYFSITLSITNKPQVAFNKTSFYILLSYSLFLILLPDVLSKRICNNKGEAGCRLHVDLDVVRSDLDLAP